MQRKDGRYVGRYLLRYRPYDKPGRKSKPEYGINISKKNMHMLKKYKFDETIKSII